MQLDKSHILIVDDEAVIRELLKVNLEEAGYVCHMAPSGDAALDVLAAETVDLALVDVIMPKMTGLTLFQHMKERHPDVAVVFSTAVDDLNLAVEHLKNGAYDYMVKPMTRKRLYQVVEESLQRRKDKLKEKQQRRLLAEQVTRQVTRLETKERELSSLNRVFQAELTKKFTAEEAAGPQLPPFEGTVSIMFTDLEGSTELLTRLGDEECQKLLRAHNVIIRQQMANHDGREVKVMGDAFMIVFSSSRSAVACAVEIQKRLQEFNQRNADRQLKVRIGINVGEPIMEDEDFFGSAVALAAKVASGASGGQILVSDLLRRLAGDTPGLRYVDYGMNQFKGFTEKQHLYEVDWVGE